MDVKALVELLGGEIVDVFEDMYAACYLVHVNKKRKLFFMVKTNRGKVAYVVNPTKAFMHKCKSEILDTGFPCSTFDAGRRLA